MTEIEKVGTGRAPRTARPTASTRKPAASKTASKAAAAGARKPADHAPAKTDVQGPRTVNIEWREDPETKKPFVYEITTEDFDDLDYVDALISMETAKNDSEKSTYAYIALKAVLGAENVELFKQREVLTQGRARFSAGIQFFNSMMEQLQKGNSGPSPAA